MRRSSTSSVWGSACAHFTEFGDRRFLVDAVSEPVTRVSLHIDNHNDMLTGNRNVVWSTEAEHKANKLNRSEQTKLESLQNRVTKEKELFQRRSSRSEQAFRAKSAKLMSRSKTIETRHRRPSSLHSNWKPQTQSLPVKKPAPAPRRVNQSKQCEMCARMQDIIRTFEIEERGRVEFEPVIQNDHTTCLFSDVQAKSFLNVLETEYLADSPNTRSKLHDSGLPSKLERGVTMGSFTNSREKFEISMAAKDVESKIRKFCSDMDRYNKEHVSIPSEVRDTLERVRLADAIAKRPKREVSSRTRIKQEVRNILNV